MVINKNKSQVIHGEHHVTYLPVETINFTVNRVDLELEHVYLFLGLDDSLRTSLDGDGHFLDLEIEKSIQIIIKYPL